MLAIDLVYIEVASIDMGFLARDIYLVRLEA